MSSYTIDLDFRVHGEGDAEISGAKFLDFLIRPGFLLAELVARESTDYKPFSLVLAIEFFQSRILFRKAAAGGDVYDEDGFALVLGQGSFLAVEEREFMLED